MNNRGFGVLLLALLALVVLLFLIFDVESVLRAVWNTPVMKPYFADLRAIIGVNVSIAQGLDPIVSNPGDPWQRTLTYPRIWQEFSEFFSLNQDFGAYFGIFNIILFILGFLMFTSKLELTPGIVFVLLLAFFSPASILVMERGNIDMLLFFMFSYGLYYIHKERIFTLIILAASVMKIFPIFAMMGLLRMEKWKFIKLLSLITVVFAVYVVFIFDDLMMINKQMPQLIYLSYGMNIIWMTVERVINHEVGGLFKILTYLYVTLLVIINLISIRKSSDFVINKMYIDSFRIGTAIFMGTFILNNNLDYRLIFLLFAIPQLVVWMQPDNSKVVRMAAFLSIITTLHSMWYLNFNRIHFEFAWIADELSNWVLFSSLVVLFMMSLPGWAIELIKNFRLKEASVKAQSYS